MLAFEIYIEKIQQILEKIRSEQKQQVEKAANLMAECILNDGMVHMFGSGHSIIPVLDAFPRYGSFVGINPLIDPRLMWFSPTGPASAPGLLLIERKEGYIEDAFLRYQPIAKGDVLVVYSHGGVNAAPVEVALYGKKVGATVIAVLSMENQAVVKPTHSSGKKLSDIADVIIDNCVPPEDALVDLEGRKERIAASSTVAAVVVTMCLVAEAGSILHKKGKDLKIFVSPNVKGFDVNYNIKIFDEHQKTICQHYAKLRGE
ncbi:MAG TPA: SIS domain-containing protein [Pseudothermotoga sp.]|nr:SIS domain-containing protein [Pseudothermotoga sp.]HOK84436.1 SIS domain-containing protein [Pseudothermotoga sp.]HPP70621.1 SIS domain-containing protein [Pseudothermotoga sp.]